MEQAELAGLRRGLMDVAGLLLHYAAVQRAPQDPRQGVAITTDDVQVPAHTALLVTEPPVECPCGSCKLILAFYGWLLSAPAAKVSQHYPCLRTPSRE